VKFRMAYWPGDNMVSALFRARFDGEAKVDPDEVEEVVFIDATRMRLLAESEGVESVAPWARGAPEMVSATTLEGRGVHLAL
jgi:isopentenyldiphosphate isomerase